MDNKTFEQAILRLEEIVKKLETGNAPLDEAIALFEEGVSLSGFCNNALNNAQQKISILKFDESGRAEEEPFLSEEN
jgi:exodeoxyribonuclease VII small subunit